MKKILIILVFLSVSFISRFSFAEIVTLDDGRIINLNEDGTFTIISEDTPNSNNDIRKSIISFLNLMNVKYESINFLNDSNLILNNITFKYQSSDGEEIQTSIEKLDGPIAKKNG